MTKLFVFLSLFLFSVFLSVWLSVNQVSAWYAFARLFVYSLFSLSVMLFFCAERNFALFAKVLSFSVLLLGVLAVTQWLRQGSVFNNYFVLGEQPYNFSTWGIVRDNFLGVTKIPSYGLFRHPNTFAGFLVISLIWLLVLVPESKLVTISFVIGVVGLFCTLSYFSWIVFVLSLLMIFIPRSYTLLITAVLVLLLLFIPYLNTENPSIERRVGFLVKSKEIITVSPLFGVGINNSSIYSPEDKFMQPVHNVFVLVFVESGIFAFVFFCVFLFYVIKTSWKKKLLYISLMAILLLSSFDHYFYTIHQTQLLFWLTVGIIYSYNSVICATKS